MRKAELVYALNAGAVDPDALARVDLEKMRLAGEHPVANLLPMVLGPAGLRPGTENLLRITGDPQTRLIKFERSVGVSYLLMLTPGEMRIIYDDAVVQVPEVATTISSGSWSDASTSPATASGGASLTLSAAAVRPARLRQTVSVAGGEINTVHVLRVVVSTGKVFLRVGSTSGDDDILNEVELDTGTHKIAFTPGATTIYVEVGSSELVTRSVSSIQFESDLLGGTGDLVIPTPWATWDDIENIRTFQSIDVIFAGDGTLQQRRIVHRGVYSWGIELYKTDNGPFVLGRPDIGMTLSWYRGNVTATASGNYFKPEHVGSLIEMTHNLVERSETLYATGQATEHITVVGVGSVNRSFVRTATASSFVGRLVLERSYDVPDPISWAPVQSWTDGAAAFAATSVSDGSDNITVHYRFHVDTYTSGSVTAVLSNDSGAYTGVARITGYTSPTVVDVEVLRNFGHPSQTYAWRIGDWGDIKGWPRTPVIHDSRMHWFRGDTDFASYVDDYTNFDDTEVGDSAPFTRSVGVGGADGVVWALSDNRLLAGTAAFEAAIAASELDEPLTPTAYTVRKIARRGCADIDPASHDEGLFYVQRSGRKLYEISNTDAGRYKSTDVTRLNPAAFEVGVVRLAVQQQPDMRLYSVLSDGSVSVLTYDADDKVAAITSIDVAGGLVEDVCVISGTDQDDVYFVVNRSGARYIERLAKEDDQRSVSTCTLLDGHKVLTGSISSITGGTHLASQTVQVWADGQRRADVTLNGSGVGALGATYSRVVYGKKYTAVFKSVKLAYASQMGPSVNQTKIIKGVGMVLASSCVDGIAVGRDASNTDPIPEIINGAERTTNQFFNHLDLEIMPINSTWDSDSRVYVQIDSAEGPCTIQAITFDIETRDGTKTG